MRRLLRVQGVDRGAIFGAHRAFRTALIISGVRCIITYLLVPIAVPIVSFAGVLAAPLSIALCGVALVNGVASVRRFWLADHRDRWLYTWFMALVFVVLGVAIGLEFAGMAA
jgi:hypothetical protein